MEFAPLATVTFFQQRNSIGPSKVLVVGNLSVKEGDDINLKCEYQSSFPASNGSLFFFSNATTFVEKVKQYLF